MSPRILFKDGLRVGKKELQLLQSSSLTGIAEVAKATARELPAVLTTQTDTGALGPDCLVTASDTNVSIATGSVLLKDGTFMTIGSAVTLAVPDGASGRPVVLKADPKPFAPGTLAIGALNRTTLAYTSDATGLAATDIYGPNDYLRLINGTSDLGTYRIQSVTASVIELAESLPGTTALADLKHSPAGKFFPGYPNVGETTDLLSYLSPVPRLETAGYQADVNEIILASVSRSGSTVTVQDTRVPLRARGVTLVTDAMVAANAGIQESKLALSTGLLTARTNAPLQTGLRDGYTTSPTFRVGGANGPRVLTTADDLNTTTTVNTRSPAMTGIELNPSTVSLGLTQTQTLTAQPVGLAGGSTVTYTFTSSDPSRVTVSTPTVSNNVATVTVTGVATTTSPVTISVSARASAVGQSYTEATQTDSTTVSVGSSGTGNQGGAIRTVTVSPRTATLSLTGTETAVDLVATVEAQTGISPTYTYAWASSNSNVTLSNTGSASGTQRVTAAAVGSATITLTVTPGGTLSGYSATPVTVTVPISVTAGSTQRALQAEPNFRVSFERNSSTGLVSAYVKWGIKGSTTISGSGSSWSVTMASNHDLTSAISSLQDQAFYTANGQRYLITSATGATPGAAITFTVSKLAATDPNPTGGADCWIQSMADGYGIGVRESASGAALSGAAGSFGATTRVAILAQGAAVTGSEYTFTLRSSNSTLANSPRDNVISNQRWGAIINQPTVTIPNDWIYSIAQANGVLFYWNISNLTNYNRDTMDFFVSTKVGTGDWSTYSAVSDGRNAAGVTLIATEKQVYAPSNTACSIRVRIADPTGVNLVNNPTTGYDAEATVMSLGTPGEALPTEYVYPFNFENNLSQSWINLGTQLRPVWVLYLSRTDGVLETSFTTAVEVVRIDIDLVSTIVADGDCAIKGVIYPLGQPTSMISGNMTTTSNSTPLTGAILNVGTTGKATIALERNGVVPTAGAGRLHIWVRPASNTRY